ncbi:hypothetical protein PENFLA_c069G04186 [Penicillium flavigenum]|uniref:Rhodopsin domain-containing protein n=1 Tax=Penicillium flavigenum TaxID=254877 RepID=A0A1V6SD28_9EURO|nr:hypothetical protein PENFLA_c069G04186 [Penicillium flavigenum]
MTDLHEDFGPTLWVVNTIFIVLATFAVIARFGARRLRKLSLGADDWIICVALFWDWLLYGIFVGCRINGLGKHRETLSPEKVATFAELLYFFQIFYVLAPPTVKLALLFLYRRIFEHSSFLRIVDGMIVLISVWAIVMTFLAIFNCKPISAFWTTEGTCLNFKEFAIGYAIVNIISDFAVWLMPIPRVWNIQLPKPQKIALSLIFALGLFDCAAAMARLLLSMRVLLKTAFGGAFARIFGMSSGKVSHQPSSTTPWSKTNEYYNDIGQARLVDVSSNAHRTNNVSELHDADWDTGSQRILVTEELSPTSPGLYG